MAQVTPRRRPRPAPARFRGPEGRPQEAQPARVDKSALDLGPLPGLIGYVLRRAQVAVYQDFARTYAHVRHPARAIRGAHRYRTQPGQKQTAVGAALGIKRANFVALCDELERRNLIVRRNIPNDRRSYALHLTPKGEALLKELHQANAHHEARVAAALGGEDRDQFIKLLTAVAGMSVGLAEEDL